MRVGDDVLVAERAVVLATGSDAALPPIDGLADAHPWTNRAATTSKDAPGRLLVLGAGPVGVELAQAWATLGSDVRSSRPATASSRARSPSPPRRSRTGSPPTASSLLRREARARRARGRARARGRWRTARARDGDELLVAVGRRPRTAGIGLE